MLIYLQLTFKRNNVVYYLSFHLFIIIYDYLFLLNSKKICENITKKNQVTQRI